MSREAELANDGRRYGKLLIAVFLRLCRDDGESIAREDLRAFNKWHEMKTDALVQQLRAEGASQSDVEVWRAGYRNEIAEQTEKAT
jgi:hypothetical protein